MTSPKLYTFNSLPLINFIEIDETKDLKFLQKDEDSEVDIVILAERWAEILQKFSDATKGKDAGELFAVVQESRGLHKINALKAIHSIWPFDKDYCLKWLKNLQVNVSTRAKLASRIVNEVNLHKRMHSKEKKKSEESSKTDWWSIVSGMARMTPPINIDTSSTTLAQFCGHLMGIKKK